MLDLKYIKDTFKVPVWQVLLRLPQSYLDTRQVVSDFSYLTDSDCMVVQGTVTSISESYNRTTVINGSIVDSRNVAQRFSHFSKLDSEYGQQLASRMNDRGYYLCKVKQVGNALFINHPQPLNEKFIGKITPVYKVKSKQLKGLKYAEFLEQHIDELIPLTARKIREELAKLNLSNGKIRRLLEAHSLCLEDVLRFVHFPNSLEESEQCNAILQRIAATLLFSEVEGEPNLTHPFQLDKDDTYFNDVVPFQLTDEQLDAVSGIKAAINNRAPRSVLFGDVGTGKTVIGAILTRHVVDAGGCVVIMVPNLILGAQIYKEIDNCWPDIGIEFLLSESEHDNFVGKGYRCINEMTEDTRVVIGTTALLHHHNNIPIDLLWIDEEQKMGLEQKESTLITHGRTHLLLSSATCIPRTQAMMSFGMLPYFKLTKYHTPREVITTRYEHTQIDEVICRVEERISRGDKVLIISTMKGESKAQAVSHRASAEQLFDDWKAMYGDIVKLSHGGLSKQDNEVAINAMKSGEGKILIATTLIEVGLTIPKLNYVVVLNPENLGVVTLHQIRGRVAREGGIGHCDLLPTTKLKAPSIDRLDLLVNHSDGFSLAEADLQLRGMGDLKNGNNQSGTSKCILVDQQLSLGLLTDTLERLTTAERCLT